VALVQSKKQYFIKTYKGIDMKRLIILSLISFCLLAQAELKAQFTLELVKIKCLVSEDSGGDETYIKVDGKKIWNYGGNDMENQDVRVLNSVRRTPFNCPILLEIYDEDSPSADDLLGQFIVNVSPSDYRNIGKEQSKEFRKQDSWYRITYRIWLDDL